MKGELSGVGPVFARVSPIPSVQASSPAWRGAAVAGALLPRSTGWRHNRRLARRTGVATAILSPSSEFKILLRFLDH
jgi:hypothetical protein